MALDSSWNLRGRFVDGDGRACKTEDGICDSVAPAGAAALGAVGCVAAGASVADILSSGFRLLVPVESSVLLETDLAEPEGLVDLSFFNMVYRCGVECDEVKCRREE